MIVKFATQEDNVGTKKRLSAQLPPTPCTDDMRSRVVQLAEARGMSIAQIQRAAIELFLSKSDSSAICDNSSPIIMEQAS